MELFKDKDKKEFGSDYIKILISELIKEKKNSSGKLAKSINYKLKDTVNELSILIESEKYLEVIDKGRKAGKYPPIKEISKWARIKGISQNAVFPIARKIFKFGIKPTNILNKVATKIENISTKNIEDKLVFNIEEEVYNNFMNNNKNKTTIL